MPLKRSVPAPGRSLLLFGALALASCTTDLGPTPAELKARWEAENVLPQHYKADLLAFLRTYLNNPQGVRNASVSAPALKDVGPGQRYVVCVRYNARDVTGKYAGVKEGAAVFASAKLENFLDRPIAVKEMCKDAAFSPFPELEALRR
jgi:hypothetical protein